MRAACAVTPGFIDNHAHYDGQVTWDPLCTFSPQHGSTTVIFGNCSLALAPVRPGSEHRTAEFLSYVEAIPMEVLNTIDVDWETIPQYMDKLDKTLGVNAGTLIGHTPVRHYVMGDDCQKRAATDDGDRRDAGRRARRADRRRAWACRCRGRRGTSIRRACRSRRCGRTTRRSSRWPTCCANSAPERSRSAAASIRN